VFAAYVLASTVTVPIRGKIADLRGAVDDASVGPSAAASASRQSGTIEDMIRDWNTDDLDTHQISSKNHVSLVRSGDWLYKTQILSYYADQGGQPVSTVHSFKWKELRRAGPSLRTNGRAPAEGGRRA
jgi:hypothetical protein